MTQTQCKEPELTQDEHRDIHLMVVGLCRNDELYDFVSLRTGDEHDALVAVEQWEYPNKADLPAWKDAKRRWRRAELAAWKEWLKGTTNDN